MYGSYGRGDAAVGSDLDLLLIDRNARGPQQERLPQWPLELLPLACDALVLSPQELGTPEKANRRLDLNAANERRVGGSHARLYSD